MIKESFEASVCDSTAAKGQRVDMYLSEWKTVGELRYVLVGCAQKHKRMEASSN